MYPTNAFILQTRKLKSGDVKYVSRNLNLLSCRKSYASLYVSLYTHTHTHTHLWIPYARCCFNDFTHITSFNLLHNSMGLPNRSRLPRQEIAETQIQSLGLKDPLEEGTATHSSILVWKIPWTDEPGRLQSIGSHRVGHDCIDLACTQAQFYKVGEVICTHLQGKDTDKGKTSDLFKVS